MSNWDKSGVAAAIDAHWNGSAFERRHREWLASAIRDVARPGSLLEAGCGTGLVYEAVRALPQVQSYCGVDSSREMLAIAAARYPSAVWRHGDLRLLERESADTVVCAEVLGHIDGDLVEEFRALILAARDTAVISLWGGQTALSGGETILGANFSKHVRTFPAIEAAISSAVPDAYIVERRCSGENVCYVIRRRLVHTVIVGSYNRPGYVREALRSVMQQDYAAWQLIVSDDGSSSETVGTLLSELGEDKRCRLLQAPATPPGPRPSGNIRAVERINDAIPLVTGDIVHYLPDDDWFLPGRFTAFNGAFRNPAVRMAYGTLRFADDGTMHPTDRIDAVAAVHEPHCSVDQTQVAHRVDCFRAVPRWPTKDIGYTADGLFYQALCRAGCGPIHPVNAQVSVHRRHRLNMSRQQRAEIGDTRE